MNSRICASPSILAFRGLLILKLRQLIGFEDLGTENLGQLQRLEVRVGLRELRPFIEAMNTIPESLPQELHGNQIRVAFVSGSKLWESVAIRAGELYAQGLVNRIIVSGHQGKLEAPEAELMAQKLHGMKVSRAHVYLDPTATNTSENARNMLQLYAQHFEGDEVVLVGKDYHSARMLAALYQELQVIKKELKVFIAHTDVYGNDWLDNPVAVAAIVGEVFRSCRYHEKPVWIGGNSKVVYRPLITALTALTL